MYVCMCVCTYIRVRTCVCVCVLHVCVVTDVSRPPDAVSVHVILKGSCQLQIALHEHQCHVTHSTHSSTLGAVLIVT